MTPTLRQEQERIAHAMAAHKVIWDQARPEMLRFDQVVTENMDEAFARWDYQRVRDLWVFIAPWLL